MPEPSILRAALKALRSIPGWPSLRVLDLSCGDGDLIEALQKEGCKAEGTHFRKNDYIYRTPSEAIRTATIHEGVDLSKRLPFADAEYDVVVATEVVEHLPSYISLCAEISRILKPDGYFVFSTPNIHRLYSRVQFMMSGQHELRGARLTWNTPSADLYSTHFTPVYFPVLHTVLYHNRMRIQKLLFTECNPLAFLLVVLYPFVLAATALEMRHTLKSSRPGGRDLMRWMMDPRMLFSDQLLAVAGKRSSPWSR